MHFTSLYVAAVLASIINAAPVADPVPISHAQTTSELFDLEARKASPISESAVQLIEKLEGFDANYYYINGDKTIGYGHDCTQKQDCGNIHPPLSRAQGEALLKKDLTGYESCVCALPNAKDLNQNQYGALVSFTYNSGCGGVQRYFESDMKKKAFTTICKDLPTTNTLGGELSSRRKQEGEFCSKATSAKSGC